MPDFHHPISSRRRYDHFRYLLGSGAIIAQNPKPWFMRLPAFISALVLTSALLQQTPPLPFPTPAQRDLVVRHGSWTAHLYTH